MEKRTELVSTKLMTELKKTNQLKISSIQIGWHIKKYWIEYSLYLFLLIVSLAVRLHQLGGKAMHHDESLHSFYAWLFSENFTLVHNPMMHGPLQMELTGILFWLFGDSDFTARLLYALIGTALIFTPLLFRDALGKIGTILVSTMLCISPTMVYFSRFARNDILMAFFTILIFTCLWKYKHTGKSKYLYLCSGLLAASYGTKETAFLITGIFSLYLLGCWINERKHIMAGLINFEQDTYVRAITKLIKSFVTQVKLGVSNSKHSRNFSFVMLIGTLALPQWTAFIGLFQNTPLFSWSGGTLISGMDSGRIGMPSGGKIIGYLSGTPVSSSTLLSATLILFSISITFYLGYKHFGKVWIRCALIFYAIWTLIYTTFFTNFPNGISSGIWQSLGYWIIQQGEGRGGQPFYYYLIITPLYEYLPLFLSLGALIYYRKKKDAFTTLLIYWTISTFIIYTIASEKMPWLLVNISLPTILLGGKFLGELIEKIEWSHIVKSPLILWVLLLPTISLVLFALTVSSNSYPEPLPTIIAFTIIGSSLIALYKIIKSDRTNKYATQISLTVIGTAALLFVLTIRTSLITNFQNPDVPVEMIVYTQTSPDILTVSEGIKSYRTKSQIVDNTHDLTISIDQTSGFTWPWSWYFRHNSSINYPVFDNPSSFSKNIPAIALVHSENNKIVENLFPKELYKVEQIPHRWWFPEHKYRNLSIVDIAKILTDIRKWDPILNYWLTRRSIAPEIGSEDLFLYVPNDFPEVNLKSHKIRDP